MSFIVSRSTAALSHIKRASIGTSRCSCRSVWNKKRYTLYYFPNSNKRFRDTGKVSRLKKGKHTAKMTVSTFCDPIILLWTLTYFLFLSNSLFLSQLLSNRHSLTAMLTSTARTPRIVDSNPPEGTFPFFRMLCCVGKRHATSRSPVQGSQQTSTFTIHTHTYTHTHIRAYVHKRSRGQCNNKMTRTL